MNTCSEFQAAVSARADGEDPGVEPALIDRHLATCVACADFAAALHAWPRPPVIAEAPPMPDLSRRVAKLNAVADRAGRWSVVRGLLAVVAVEIVVLSAPALVLGRDGSVSTHAARHLGAFSVAYAVGLLVVVARPARARTMLPVALFLASALAVTAVVDIAEGRVPLLGEAAHLPEVVSVLLVWMLARPAPERRSVRLTAPPSLRAVRRDPRDGDRDGGAARRAE
jgi:predicted anti-sigma-YlaC factor YlaD